MSNLEIKKALVRKLNRNMDEYMRRLMGSSPNHLFVHAEEIAAAKTVHCLLQSGTYPDELLEYLLRFEDPLEVVRDQWLKNNGFSLENDMEVALGHLAEKREAERDGYELDADWMQAGPAQEQQMG